MARKVIITCAVTGGAALNPKHPSFPITPKEIAESAIGATKAGATSVHIHVRDPETGAPSGEMDHYREVVDRIRDSGVETLINLTTGYGARFVPSEEDPAVGGEGTIMRQPEDRVAHILELRPDICSLDTATFNFGSFVFVNTPEHLAIMARLITEAGIKPELEVFEIGHIILANHLADRGLLKTPAHYQLCLGIGWSMRPTRASIQFMRDHLPEDATWAAFGISRFQFPMVRETVALGGHVRVGLEDNLYLEKGVFAPTNASLVDKAAEIIQEMGHDIANPAEAREILGL